MFDALARLADRRPRRIGLLAVAFFLVAGALGGSVASRLDPYGADDPATESVKAREALQQVGFHGPGAIVIVRNAPVAAPASRARVKSIANELRRRRDVASVTGYFDTRSRAFVSSDGRSTYLAVGLRPTSDKQWQAAGNAIAEQLANRPNVVVGGGALAQEQVNKQVEKDLQRAEMLAFPLLFFFSFLFFRSLVAAMLPVMIGLLAIVGTFLILRILSELGSISIFALNLTPGWGWGCRSTTASSSSPATGRRSQRRAGPGRDAAGDGHCRAHRLLLLADGRRCARFADRVPAALPLLDGTRRRDGDAAGSCGLADRAAGGPHPARHSGQLALTALPPPPRRGRGAGPTSGFWYRLSRFVMRRPMPIAALSALFLIVLGLRS